MITQKLRIGIDVGGTKIAVGAVDTGGRVMAMERLPTPETPQAVLQIFLDSVASLLRRQGKTASDLAAVGLAFPADFDSTSGRVLTAPNLPAFVGLQPGEMLRVSLERRFLRKIPVAVDNDACAAVLAEAYYGAGKGCARLLYLTVSTGVGGARFDGTRTENLEPGLSTFPDDARPTESLENLAGGAALARRAQKQLRAGLETGSGGEPPPLLRLDELAELSLSEAIAAVSARHLAAAADRGDTLSRELLADSCRMVAAAIRLLLLQGFGEERVVVGGSIALKTSGYLERLRENLAAAFREAGETSPLDPYNDLSPAALGDETGVVGAALFTRRTQR